MGELHIILLTNLGLSARLSDFRWHDFGVACHVAERIEQEVDVLESLYSTERGLARVRRCWLRSFIDAYFGHLTTLRFKASTLRVYANQLLELAAFAEQHGCCKLEELPQWISPFLAQRRFQRPQLGIWRSTLTRFIDYWRKQGLIPVCEAAVPKVPNGDILAEHLAFLVEHRGVCRQYLKGVESRCLALLAWLDADGTTDLRQLNAEQVHRFLIQQGNRYSRVTMSSVSSTTRRFLSFLYRRGVTPRDQSLAVVSPRLFRQEQCPRFLTSTEIEAALAVINRETVKGRRDYAMLQLLVVYGLRGIEVIRLRLDQIDWRREQIHILRRKAGNNTCYPLAVSVGEALLDYLRHGRPVSQHREVFLSLGIPFTPLAYSAALGAQVRKCLLRAGIHVERPGTHTFRYSCAQRLFDEGMPLKSIGDYIGHRSPDSTERYTKIAIRQLREVACGDGEDVLG